MMFDQRSAKPPKSVNRRTFTPPKQRHVRGRFSHDWPPEDWRSRIPAAMLRAFIAVAFASTPAYVDRFGDATLPLACFGLGTFAALIAYALYRSEAAETVAIAAADAVTLVLLVPLVSVASDVLVADSMLGGGTSRFMAAALGVMAAASVVGVVAAFGRREIGSLAMLAAALVVVTGFVGAQRFSSDAFADGMSLAWMMAALATLVDGLIRDRLRPMVPIVVAAASLILMVVMSRAERGVTIPEGSVLLALLVAAGTSGMLFVVPVLAERVRQAGGGQ